MILWSFDAQFVRISTIDDFMISFSTVTVYQVVMIQLAYSSVASIFEEASFWASEGPVTFFVSHQAWDWHNVPCPVR